MRDSVGESDQHKKKFQESSAAFFWDNSSTYNFINRKKFEFQKMFYYADRYNLKYDNDMSLLTRKSLIMNLNKDVYRKLDCTFIQGKNILNSYVTN